MWKEEILTIFGLLNEAEEQKKENGITEAVAVMTATEGKESTNEEETKLVSEKTTEHRKDDAAIPLSVIGLIAHRNEIEQKEESPEITLHGTQPVRGQTNLQPVHEASPSTVTMKALIPGIEKRTRLKGVPKEAKRMREKAIAL